MDMSGTDPKTKTLNNGKSQLKEEKDERRTKRWYTSHMMVPDHKTKTDEEKLKNWLRKQKLQNNKIS